MMAGPVQAVLFDLDGTLIDSAPDLAGACNDMRLQRGLPALEYTRLRCMVGSGARGMIGVGFGIGPTDPGYDELREEFLRRYEARMTQLTRVFDSVPPVLDTLAQRGLPWGIVTNKAMRFSEPLVAHLGLAAATVVSGDSTPHAKPHPAPLLEAARRLGVAAGNCIYVGDDRRDVEAGRAAGMGTVVAAWGYLGENADDLADWGAGAVIEHPAGLLDLLQAPVAAGLALKRPPLA